MIIHFDSFTTPLGGMTVAATETGAICLLDFSDCRDRSDMLLHRRFGAFDRAVRPNPQGVRDRLADYFAGRDPATAFDKLVLDSGGTPFQKAVWTALRQIPYGQTISYSELAAMTPSPGAVRAAGGANGRNPVAIIIPCHRVIAKNGGLSGYAGGTGRKRRLLTLEGSLKR